MHTPQSILVFRSAALGDFVLASPALRVLRGMYPDCRIVLLTIQSANKSIQASVSMYSPTDAMPWLQLAVPHLIDEVIALKPPISLRYLIDLRSKLRAQHFDQVILFVDPGAPWIGRVKKLLLLMFLSGFVPIYGWRARGSLSSGHITLRKKGLLRHHVHGSLQFLSELSPPRSYDESDIKFDLRPPPHALQWASAWVRDHVPIGSRLVFMAPGSIQPHKRWPIENFIKLCNELMVDFNDLYFVVIGTPADHLIGEAIRRLAPDRISNLAGETTVAQSAALLQWSHLLVGNDGGAMHLGDAVGSRVVSIVPGIQYPDSIEPWNNRNLAVRHDVPCAPCYSFLSCPQGHNKCMRDLPVERVLQNCRQVLLMPNCAKFDTSSSISHC